MNPLFAYLFQLRCRVGGLFLKNSHLPLAHVRRSLPRRILCRCDLPFQRGNPEETVHFVLHLVRKLVEVELGDGTVHAAQGYRWVQVGSGRNQGSPVRRQAVAVFKQKILDDVMPAQLPPSPRPRLVLEEAAMHLPEERLAFLSRERNVAPQWRSDSLRHFNTLHFFFCHRRCIFYRLSDDDTVRDNLLPFTTTPSLEIDLGAHTPVVSRW